ncbi:Rho guanine nucleotide exchange factor 12 Leukemia-associated RhoGEF [Larimichthys crocea]|uniref:Rho guanine nucleotide exchange factor 12 Leukemia-associated RhoGEF n=1 Tax=Larimichthys crocea TaxID=215358 RepID=A0A6G0I854_LARCR|nr:Rho guanine nucleotide exchange factor 12 Leukemia-associated RhoGEF [Larimichthys crocea]
MSGTQSTLTDRTPSILNKDPTDKKPKNEKSSVSLKHEFDPTGLVQRCVIIQRDENGFGLTVSGDNPVFVQLVKKHGAAMRAGVQTGDRIIKVNGTLVTHSNHIEVVKLIKSGSYVALTVLGRPPGLPHVPLEEGEEEEKEEGAEVSTLYSSLSVPHSPALPGGERSSHVTSSPQEHITSFLPDGPENKPAQSQKADNMQKMLLKEQQDLQSKEEESSRDSGPSLHLREQANAIATDGTWTNNNSMHSSPLPESTGKRETPCQARTSAGETVSTSTHHLTLTTTLTWTLVPSLLWVVPHIPSTPRSSEQKMTTLTLSKSRLMESFDPAPLLCYLYADMHKQTSSKESRRFFMEFHSLFMDRTANLKVPLPESIAGEMEKRRLELIPEDICKQYTQVLQDTLLPDLHKNLEDFRQKRSMGLTLAEDELSKLDTEQGKEALEKECSCAEHILSKIEDILLTSQPTEEEKCQTMQYVILTYMKHLGVKVKEPRGLEHKRARINFLPKIKKSIKPEKEGEEKGKKPRFPNILGPPRRLSRVDSTSVGKAVEMNKQRSPKQLPQPAFGIPEQSDSPAPNSGRTRVNQPSEGSDTSTQFSPSTISPIHSSPTGQASDTSGHDSDSNLSPFCIIPRPGESLQSGDHQDGVFSPTNTQFDFSPSNLEQLQEEDQETFRRLSGQEVINELFYTERAHLRTLKVLDCVFYQRLNRDSILPPEDIKHIFINLEEIIQLHVSIMEQMTAIRKRSETSVIGQIADDLLAWFSGEGEEKIKKAVGTFCSNQPSALELIKSKKKKDQRFTLFMQEAESNRLCRRLQLKDIIPVEMQRVTKYPLLLDNIAKYTEDGEEREKVKKAGECCKKILNHVNQAVKEAENKLRLEEYQRRLDLSSLKTSENPMILELKNLDLTKRKMVHEGPLSWKVNKDKTIELYTILLEDILHIFSPIIKLNTVLVRPVATHNKSFFVLSMSENGAQIYELMAQTVSDQRTWQCLITQCADAMKAKPHNRDAPPAQSDAEGDAIEIIKHGMPKTSKDPNRTSSGSIQSSDKDATSSPDVQAPASMNPFDGMKSEDEEEELAVGDRQEEEELAVGDRQEEEELAVGDRQEEEELAVGDRQEEEDDEEVDEAELEAFLDGQLADRMPFLQEGSRQGIALENQDHDTFSLPTSKGEEALRTLAMLKQAVFTHILSREAEEETEENKPSSGPEGPSATCDESGASTSSQKDSPHLTSGLPEATERNGGFMVLDFGGGFEESSTDDDGGVAGDVGIDMRKLLSSSSQTGGSCGPNLNRQLMTHLRLLQADLQYLKEVEMKYNELRQTHSDLATDLDDNNDGIQ